MAKVVLNDIASGYLSAEALNAAMQLIEETFERVLFRDGAAPNNMQADIDMDGHNILNLGPQSDLLTQAAMEEYVDQRASGMLMIRDQIYTATVGQTVFAITEFTYEVGAGNLAVYVNGVRKFAPTDYTETDGSTITFLVGLSGSEKVHILNTEFIANITLPVHTHPWSEISGVPEYATRWPNWGDVQGKPATFPAEAHTHTAADIVSGRIVDARRGVHVQASQPVAATAGELWFW